MTVLPKFSTPNISLNSALTCLLAIATQIQLTLFASQDYIGLRISSADLILPLAGIGILWSLLNKKSYWPNWHIIYVPIGMLIITAVITFSLIQGYYVNGFLSNWAFTNKFIGFLTLLSYTLLGGWLASQRNQHNNLILFLKVFCAFQIMVLIFSIIMLTFQTMFYSSVSLRLRQWEGFMANRNAFMLCIIFAMVIMVTYRHHTYKLFPAWVYSLFWTLMPFFFIFNASRTGWIIGGFILLISMISSPTITFKKILSFVLLGFVLLLVFISAFEIKPDNIEGQVSYLNELISEKNVTYQGDKARIIDYQDGLSLYRLSNPFTGAGLGVYQESQLQNRGYKGDIIDSTPLWLLVEMGIFGSFAFIGFFALCLYLLYKKGFKADSSLSHRCLFFCLIAFSCVSILHEITYTRFVWFMLGLALVSAPPLKHSKVSE